MLGQAKTTPLFQISLCFRLFGHCNGPHGSQGQCGGHLGGWGLAQATTMVVWGSLPHGASPHNLDDTTLQVSCLAIRQRCESTPRLPPPPTLLRQRRQLWRAAAAAATESPAAAVAVGGGGGGTGRQAHECC